MKKLIGTALVFASLAFVAQPTSALEGGVEDTNNPRVVYLYGCTGFLFAPRIVITAAHCNQVDRAMEPGRRTSWARTPQDSARVIEFFEHADFKPRSPGYPELSDFGVAILERPLAYVPEAKIIDEATLLGMAEARELVTFSGYGLQSLKDRINSKTDPRNVFPRTTQFELIPKAEGEARIANMVEYDSMLESYPEGLIMVNQPQLGAQTCDGDSGSGYYLRDGDSFTFVGVTNWPLGIRNCYVEDFTQSWYKGDATVGVFPAYNGLDVIQKARDYVAANPLPGEAVVSPQKNNFVLPRFVGEPNAGVKERVQRYAVANSKMTKFICTSVRLSSTPSRAAIAMRAQAKAVCDYAKKVNPDLKTWYQSKVSNKAAAVGMQLITIKFD